MNKVAQIWDRIQGSLFPRLEEALAEPLTEKLRQLIAILEVLRIEEQVASGWLQWMGRKRKDRRALARAFVAKAVYNLSTTELLIEMLRNQPNLRRICGWERKEGLPSSSTFSRAFSEFAERQLGDRVHEVLVREQVSERLVGHISRDATEIEAREKPAKKEKVEPKRKGKRGRPRKGEVREPKPETRLEKQVHQRAEEALAELPTGCDVGTKVDSKGHKHSWIGYKTHLDVADGGLPITVITTSASLHDSQVAIPMAKRTAERVTALYELMDSAYDAAAIYKVCQSLGHKPIIDPNPRRKGVIPFDPATGRRFDERTTVERAHSRLKDEFGGRQVRVRGHAKVHLHIMFGIIALFADQLLKMIT